MADEGGPGTLPPTVMIHVRWDSAGPPTQFTIGDPPLTRIDLDGQQVRLVSTGEKAVVMRPTASGAPTWVCFVASSHGPRTVNVPESDLRPVALTEPVERFTVRYLESQNQTQNPFIFSKSILCSSYWVSNPKWAELCSKVDWDLVIVDEAHHARSHRSGSRVTTTRLYRLVSELAEPDHFA